MKTFGTKSRRVLVLLCGVAMVAVLGLLPRQVVAQNKADADQFNNLDDEQGEQGKQGEQAAKAQSTSGKFKITVDRVRRVEGHPISIAESGFPLTGGKGSQEIHAESFPGGQKGGATATMGGGSGGAFVIPNLILDVLVQGAKTGNKHQLICTVDGGVHAVDDQGHEASSPGLPSWLRLELTGVEYRRGPGRTAIHLALPQSDPAARYLKSVDGTLQVAEGTVSEIAFQGKELTKATEKHVNGVSARLEKISRSPEGIDVKLSASPPKKANENINPMNNPMEHLQQMMLTHAPGRVRVVLVDSAGNTHAASSNPRNSSGGGSFNNGGGGSGGGSASGSWGTSGGGSGTGGGGGGTSGGGSWGTIGPGGKRSGSFSSSSSDSNQAQGFHFDPLPEGVTVKSIVCTVIDLTGQPQPVPFHLENIPLPTAGR